jgi:hypothetical protein
MPIRTRAGLSVLDTDRGTEQIFELVLQNLFKVRLKWIKRVYKYAHKSFTILFEEIIDFLKL